MMFWDYIVKKLAFIPVLNPGPIAALVEGAAGSLDAARADILSLRGAMMPETADPACLPIIAGRRGILRWPDETLDAYRTRTTIAFLYWKRGGNPPGLTGILHEFGYEDVEVIEHTQAIWAEISVAMGVNHAVPNTSYLVRLINDVKPARSRLRGLNLVSQGQGRVNAGPAVVRNQIQNQTTMDARVRQELPVGCAGVALAGMRTAVTSTRRNSPVESALGAGGVIRELLQTHVTPDTGFEGRFQVRAGCMVKTTIRSEIEG